MIEGRNTLTLTKATICKAVEYYLNAEVFRQPMDVISVDKGQYEEQFTVEVEASELEDRVCRPADKYGN